MSMSEVIESIEKDMWRDLESRSIPESQPEMIDCTTLGEEPNSQHICGRISNGYSSKVPCISKDDSMPEELRRGVEEALKKRYCSTCRHYIERDGECCNADSDYCGGFRGLDDSCEHWEGWKNGKV